MRADRPFTGLWEDPPPPVVAPSQLLFITVGIIDPARSYLDLTLREYCGLRDSLARALGGHENVRVGVSSTDLTISAEGDDVNALWERCAPLLELPALRGGITVMRRYGGPGARELISRM
jgi:hypothetical protein